MKNPTRILLTTLLVLAAVQTALISDASACDPAESHYPSVLHSDAPSCLQFEAYDGWSAQLTVRNDCEDAATIEVIDCVSCAPELELEVAAGEYEFLVIDESSAEEYDFQTREQSFSWTLAEEEGVLETEVFYRDTADACDGWNSGGCSSSNSSVPVGDTTLLVLFALVLFLRGYGAVAISADTR